MGRVRDAAAVFAYIREREGIWPLSWAEIIALIEYQQLCWQSEPNGGPVHPQAAADPKAMRRTESVVLSDHARCTCGLMTGECNRAGCPNQALLVEWEIAGACISEAPAKPD